MTAKPPEFRVSHGKTPQEDGVPEDLLLAFENNYRSERYSRKRIITATSVLLFFIMLGGWYLKKQKPELSVSAVQQTTPVTGQIPTHALTPPAPVTQSSPAEQKMADAEAPKSSHADALPAFIPRAGQDKNYADKNPGWESYAGKQHIYRVFKEGGRLKAVQIIAGSGRVISASLVSTVLTELAETSEYQISSQEKKSGFLILKGVANDKADLIFYKKEEEVRAFVVSLR